MRRPWGRTVPGHGKTSEETPWLEQGVREGGTGGGGTVTVAGRAELRGRGQDLAFTRREVGPPVSLR